MSFTRVYGADIEYGTQVVSGGIPHGEISWRLGGAVVRSYPYRVLPVEKMEDYLSGNVKIDWRPWPSGFRHTGRASSVLPLSGIYREKVVEERVASPEGDASPEESSRSNRYCAGPLDEALRAIDEDLSRQGQSWDRFLVTGARFYEDHYYPEICTPEVTRARDVVRYIKAGELHLNLAAKILQENLRNDGSGRFADAEVKVYGNNHDFAGHSFGSHENYLVDRTRVKPDDLVIAIMPFFCSRIAFIGLGTLGPRFEHTNFYVSQRALFTETEVGIQTTHDRPIVNLRDEPHTREGFYRLHVISGDSNRAETALYLKFGTMGILLRMLEEGALDTHKFLLRNPVGAMRSWGKNLTENRTLYSGGRVSAAQHLEMYLEDMVRFGQSSGLDEEEKDVLKKFEFVVESLLDNPKRLVGVLDWPTHLRLLDQTVDRGKCEWGDPALHQVSLRYCDIDPKTGLYHILSRKGKIDRIVTDEEIIDAVNNPPEDTRAYVRGKVLERWPDTKFYVDWHVIELGKQKLKLDTPLVGSKGDVSSALESSDTAEEFFNNLLCEVN